MKKVISLVALIFIFMLSANAQKDITPKYRGEAVIINADSTITSLEKTDCQLKAIGSPFGAGKASLVVDGIASSLRLQSGKEVKIVVRLGNNNYEPTQFIKVYKLNIKKKKYREAIMVRINAFSSSPTENGLIKYSAEQYGKDCYILTINGLEPGEYGVQVISYTSLYCFGID